MRNILKDKVFWIFFLLAAVIVFIASTANSRTYQANSRILFVPKNEVAARNIGQIVQNAKQIPLSLSFYNKIVEINSSIDDAAMELPDAKRKAYWNSKIETRQVDDSDVVEVSVYDQNQMQTEIISDQVIEGILTVMGNYYGAENGIDMHVIDRPVSREINRIDYAKAFGFSLPAGIVIGLLASILISSMSKAFESKPIVEKEKIVSKPVPVFQKPSLPEVPAKKMETFEKKKDVFDFKVEDEAALVQTKKFGFFGSREKKASAPSNLPVAEEFDFKVSQTEVVAEKEDLKKEVKADNMAKEENEFVLDMGGAKKETPANPASAEALSAPNDDHKREATPEEVKERLNRLLSGDDSK